MKAGKDGRTFPTDGLIKTEADLDMIDLPDPTRDEFYRDAEEFVKNKGEYACHLSTRIGLSQVMLSLGMENFALMLYDNRKLVEQMLDIYFDWTAEMAQRISQLGYDIFWTTDDFAFKTGLFFSPRMIQDPRAAALVDDGVGVQSRGGVGRGQCLFGLAGQFQSPRQIELH